jgi:2-phosphosulfolactate phosphatase
MKAPRKIEVCLSPKLISLYPLEDKLVVVIDVLRATTAICMGFEHGVKTIRPVMTIEESLALKAAGYLAAAERDGKVVEGFDFGNSPFAYMDGKVRGKKIALTTTNGTKAIQLSKAAKQVYIGAFVNLQAVVETLAARNEDILLVCAGWKDNFNLEDTLFAGAVVHQLAAKQQLRCDAALAATILYEKAQKDLFGFIRNSSHFQRLAHMGIEEDIRLSMTPNLCRKVPYLRGEELTAE